MGSAAQGQAAAAPVDGTGAGADGGPWVPSRRGREGSHGTVDEMWGEPGLGRTARPDESLVPVDSVAPLRMVVPPGGPWMEKNGKTPRCC